MDAEWRKEKAKEKMMIAVAKKNTRKKNTPLPGIEPGSPA
jgi:hypothetical protein